MALTGRISVELLSRSTSQYMEVCRAHKPEECLMFSSRDLFEHYTTCETAELWPLIICYPWRVAVPRIGVFFNMFGHKGNQS